jgi:hypothetical protein
VLDGTRRLRSGVEGETALLIRSSVRLIVAMAAACEGSGPVAAAQAAVPYYDVPALDAHCGKLATSEAAKSPSAVIGNSAQFYADSCIQSEQDAYNALEQAWPTLPDDVTDYCETLLVVTLDSSYSLLKGCVELKLRTDQPADRFDY